MSETKIRWTNKTWNPIIGCNKISPGCDNCYAEKMAFRLAHMEWNILNNIELNYCNVIKSPDKAEWNGKTYFRPSELLKPFKWKKPKKIFVVSMGDLFHKSVPHSWIHEVLEMIQNNKRHTFIILTKRPENALKFFDHLRNVMKNGVCKIDFLPIENLWLGVTVENQEQADKRIPILLQIPAKVRFLSCEPLLGAIDLTNIRSKDDPNEPAYPEIDWVIAGGESGLNTRPMNPDWVRSLRDQCEKAKVSFFFKQWGEYCYANQLPQDEFDLLDMSNYGTDNPLLKLGKHRTGSFLDGVVYNQFPK